jgi:hypothetical protein
MMGSTPHGPGFSPQAHCLDDLARQAGFLGYLEARLNLGDAQVSLWQRLEEAAKSAAATQRKTCASLPASAETKPPTLPQRLKDEKQMLAARLAMVMAIQPPLVALYDSLSPEQRAILDPRRPVQP